MMASLNASSLAAPERSDKLHDNLCGPCSIDGVKKDAKHYCQDCGQNICNTCKDYHRKFAGTRNHTIGPVKKDIATSSAKRGQINVSRYMASMETYNRKNIVLLGRKVQRFERDVGADDPTDTERPCVTGSTVMANGNAVLCDNRNGKIKLIDSSGFLTDRLKLSGLWNVSVLDSMNVIVTIPKNKHLQVVQVSPQLKPGRVIKLDKECWGVEVLKEEIYVTCHNAPGEGEIRVLGLDGKVKRRLGVDENGAFMFTAPYYITVNSSGKTIFISDMGTNTVTCMSVDGGIIYTYNDDSMKSPMGLLCDSEDNILVFGWHSHNAQVLTADGKRHCTLMTEDDGLAMPNCIAYRDIDKTLFVGCDYNIDLLSFKLSS